jgi:hypothetical protein
MDGLLPGKKSHGIREEAKSVGRNQEKSPTESAKRPNPWEKSKQFQANLRRNQV